VSTYKSSLACEEIRDTEEHLLSLLPLRYLSISDVSAEAQPVLQVVKVSGNITVSF